MIKPGRAADYRDREDAIKKPEPAPKTLFEKYERAMQDGFRAYCEAIAAIKNRYLYRQIGYDTFDECCEKRWGISARHGYRLAGADATMKSLAQSVTNLVTNPSQVRAIATVPKNRRVEILKTVAKSGPVTARRITEAINRRMPVPIVIDVEAEPEKITARNPCPACGGTGFAE